MEGKARRKAEINIFGPATAILFSVNLGLAYLIREKGNTAELVIKDYKKLFLWQRNLILSKLHLQCHGII